MTDIVATPPSGAFMPRDELAVAERRKYMAMWEQPAYHRYSPGREHAPRAIELLRMKAGESLYDLGCGAGAAIPLFCAHGLLVRGIDIAMSPALANYALQATKHLHPARRPILTLACLWALPMDYAPRDYVFCADVLEHIPPDRVDSVLMHMARLMRSGGYLNIHCRPDGCGALIGETLHLTVQPPEWWIAKLTHYFTVLRLPGTGRGKDAGELTCIVKPREAA